MLALALFGFIFFMRGHKRAPIEQGSRVLPEIKAALVTAVQVRPSGPVPLGIHAERTNGTWQLVEPIRYSARGTNIDKFIASLESLTAATRIRPEELSTHPNVDEEFGFAAPRASIIVQQGGYRAHILVGNLTPPGDQVYVQVVAREGISIVNAAWLNLVPRSANDWRETALVEQDPSEISRVAVTNQARAFVLQRDTNALWRIAWPRSARADHSRIEEALHDLGRLRVEQFISDEPKPDLDSFGLGHPEMELALCRGTNEAEVLQFGKPVSTATNQLYARWSGQNAIFAVALSALGPWRSASVNEFRDPHLLTVTEPIRAIGLRGETAFTVERQTNDTWWVMPDSITADAALVGDLLSCLTNMQIVQFTKDVVNAPELPEFGLASPLRTVTVETGTAAAASATNCLTVQLDFGMPTNATDKVFARRRDETSVYAISTNDYARLPVAGWQLRERRLWQGTEQDVAGLRIEQQGKVRELIRRGDHLWSLAAGSQGIINDLAVEETVRGLMRASARAWVARGTENLSAYGLDKPHKITLFLKSGDRLAIDFGKSASPEAQYAAIRAGDQLYVMEFSWAVYRDVASYLSIP